MLVELFNNLNVRCYVRYFLIKYNFLIEQYSNDDSWSELFPVEDSKIESSKCISICVEDSLIWRKLYPIESSPALSYQWNNSYANKKLLSALNIDSRNIVSFMLVL